MLDFKLLKQVMRPTVDYLDHRMINDLEPFVSEINPSAENLAKYFYQQTSAQLHHMTHGRVRVKDCTLYETDTSFARSTNNYFTGPQLNWSPRRMHPSVLPVT